MVPGAGVEPACPRGRQILSLLRLPISPSRLNLMLALSGLLEARAPMHQSLADGQKPCIPSMLIIAGDMLRKVVTARH